MSNEDTSRREKETKLRQLAVLLIYPTQLIYLLALFFLFPRGFGYICLGSLVLGQAVAIAVSNLLPNRECKLLFVLIRFFGGGFYGIAKNFSDLEKRGGVSRSLLQVTAFFVHCIAVVTLFYVWMARTPEYVIFSLIMSATVSVFFFLTREDIEEKLIKTVLIFMMFGYGYLLFLCAVPPLYFFRYGARYKRLDGKSNTPSKKRMLSTHTVVDYLSDCGFPVFHGDKLEYFPTGARFFDDLIERLEAAKEFIYIEFFIYDRGELIDRLVRVLERKLGEGVEVRIIYDDYATYEAVSKGIFPSLKALGAKFAVYNRVVPLTNTFTHYRDHRKIVVIDGKCAYTGGVNVADEYINKARHFGYWKDCGVRIEGSSPVAFRNAFRRQWYAVSGEKIQNTADPCENSTEGAITIPFFDRMTSNLSREVYYTAINEAKESLTLIAPYLLPGRKILRLLAKKAKEGVDVRLIIPGTVDKRYVYSVTKINAAYLADRGVRVYSMNSSFTHSKIILSENLATVCTANPDYLSFYKCAECGIVSSDEELRDSIALDMRYVMQVSCEMTGKDLRKNKWDYISGLFLRLFSIIM